MIKHCKVAVDTNLINLILLAIQAVKKEALQYIKKG